MTARRACWGALLCLSACAHDRTSGSDSASSAATASAPASPSAATGPAKPACERTGHWNPCQVRDRIDRAGLTPRDSTDKGGLPALGPTPVLYRVGKAGLAVYLFPDSIARVRAGRLLDTVKFIPYEHELTVLSEATVIQNDNLLALLFSKNDHQRERVSDALTAGPPQR